MGDCIIDVDCPPNKRPMLDKLFKNVACETI